MFTVGKRPIFKIGDDMRISVAKGKFEKDYIILIGVKKFLK
jgi:hypothetical protein